MNGTPIENLRYTQQMPQQQFQQPMSLSTNMPESDLVNDDLRRHVNMDTLSREVTETLDDVTLPEHQVMQQQGTHRRKHRTSQHDDDDDRKKTKNSIMKNIPEYLHEPLIIFVIYMILSLDIVKKALASYIPQLKPNGDGNVQLVGIAVYGMILGIIYSVVKKLLL